MHVLHLRSLTLLSLTDTYLDIISNQRKMYCWDQKNWKHLELDEKSDKMLSIRLENGAWCLGFCQVNMAH